jgi:hypothetical protein
MFYCLMFYPVIINNRVVITKATKREISRDPGEIVLYLNRLVLCHCSVSYFIWDVSVSLSMQVLSLLGDERSRRNN